MALALGNTAHSLSMREASVLNAEPGCVTAHSSSQLQTQRGRPGAGLSAMNKWTRGLRSVPSDLTLVDVESPLRHVAHPSLRLLAAERVEVVDVRRFVRDFKIADTAVTLQESETDQCLR